MRRLLWLILFTSPVLAQPLPLPGVTASATAAPSATPVILSESPNPTPAQDGPMSTPKRTLDTFLAIMAQANPLRPDLEAQARECMDLSRLNPLTRSDKGSLLAYKLNSVLLTVKTTPDLSGPSPVTLLSRPEGTLQLAQDGDGNWRFTPDSVDHINELFNELHRLPETATSPWQRLVLGAPVWKWTSLGLWFILGLVWERAVSRLVARFVVRSQQRLGNTPQGQASKANTATGRLIAVMWWTLGLTLLQPPMEFQLVTLLLLRLMAFYFCLLASFRWLDLASAYFIAQQAPNSSGTDREMFVPLLRRTCKTFVALLLLSMLGRSLNLDITGLLAGFSILGAMVALAGQDTVKNIFGSLTVLVDRSFQVGDRISVQGVDGVVEDLGFRSTRIRTAEDTLVTLPNSLLLTSSVDNWGRRTGRRFATGITVDYSSTPENIEKFCQQVSESLAHQAAPTRSVSVTASALNDYGIRLDISFLVETYDSSLEAQVRHAAIMEILRSVRQCELSLVYPSQRILMQKIEGDGAVTNG